MGVKFNNSRFDSSRDPKERNSSRGPWEVLRVIFGSQKVQVSTEESEESSNHT